MSRSTKLASAAYILSFIASRHPDQLTSDLIAEVVEDHPARVRQLISALGKAGLIQSVRGANGGVVLGRAARDISLRDIYEAVEEQPMVSLLLRRGYVGWGPQCKVHDTLSGVFDDVESKFLARLGRIRLTDLYTMKEPAKQLL
jgi:Rrf2 family protein